MKHLVSMPVLLALACMLLSLFGPAAQSQEQPNKLLPELTVLRGEFQQIRTLKGFKNPLKSEGRFLVSGANGVVWQSIKPFPSQILVTKTGKIINLANRQSSPKPNGKKPNAAFSKIMLAMMSGNQAELAKYFNVSRSETKTGWTIKLLPKGGMARVFSLVEIRGERYIDRVLMEEKSGDKTELFFSAVSELPDSLSDEEKNYFR